MKYVSNALNLFGTTYSEFKTALKELVDHTHVLKTRSNDLSFVFPCKRGADTADAISVAHYDKEAMDAEREGKIVPTKRLPLKLMPGEFFSDFHSEELPIIQTKESPRSYFVSQLAMPTLCQMAGVGGEDTINCGNEFRNKHLAYQLTGKKRDLTLIYREEIDEGFETPLRKIISVNSGRYGYIPQTCLCDIIESFVTDGVVGEFDVKGWGIKQEFTQIAITFPEIAKDFDATYKLPSRLTPGMILQTSDAATSSVTVKGVVFYGRTYTVLCERSIAHTYKNSVKKFTEECEKEMFKEYRKLPELLVRAMAVDIGDPCADLTDPVKAAENHDTVMARVVAMSAPLTAPRSMVPRKLYKALMEAISAEINPELHYTLYDLDLLFLSLPERVNVNPQTLEALRKACSAIPYKADTTPITAEEDELVLLPA